MKKILLLLCSLFVLLTQTAIAAAVSDGNSFIPKGTPFAVELIDPASSETAFVGQTLEFKVLDDYVIENVVVVPAGSKGYVSVSKVVPAGSWGRGGGLELEPKYLTTANFVKVALTDKVSSQENSRFPLQGALFVPFALIPGHLHVAGAGLLGVDSSSGKDREILDGTKLIVVAADNVDLGVTVQGLSEAMTAEPVKKKAIDSEVADLIPDFAGTWRTSKGFLTIKQTGKRITGQFADGDKFVGKIQNGVATGNFKGFKFMESLETEGEFKLDLQANGKMGIYWMDKWTNCWTINTHVSRVVK